jgi:hypothetical protein
MNATQSWAGLPDHIKRQAAPDMQDGKGWYYFGKKVEHPGADELRRWAGIAPQSPQEGAKVAGSITAAERGFLLASRTRTRVKRIPPIFNNRAKREAVEKALRANPTKSNREIATMTRTTHPLVGKVRRSMETVST